ncbi:hypothetical protein RHGRI_021255 [Rhododendron griersonianum]|uniref:Uncharacterized protein n=1 Tax=Rhododendron griersonianum TaxID=479676 RepID=A0AAV6JP11_9ERIC|nr:hypothetical protein RHGRI_021254 [Rhododendron griersonianum]KAG5541360.1 hypothetical protein RHGRI_021255 [Rhododendron griersonianum]
MMSLESVPLTMPPNKECGEQKEVWSADSEHEETIEDGKEETENYENKVEEPKEGTPFDTSEDAYLYLSRPAPQTAPKVGPSQRGHVAFHTKDQTTPHNLSEINTQRKTYHLK